MVINYSQIEINCFVLFLDFILLDMTKGINVCFWKASNDILHLTFPKEIEIFIRGKDEDKGIGKKCTKNSYTITFNHFDSSHSYHHHANKTSNLLNNEY